MFLYAKFEKLCEEKKVTPYHVSKETGVSTATLSSWKQFSNGIGGYTPKADKIQRIADYFGVPLEYFIESKNYKDYAVRGGIGNSVISTARLPVEPKDSVKISADVLLNWLSDREKEFRESATERAEARAFGEALHDEITGDAYWYIAGCVKAAMECEDADDVFTNYEYWEGL